MNSNELELGYACDLALDRLMLLYSSSEDFRRDLDQITKRPELSICLEDKIKSKRGLEPLLAPLEKNRDIFTRHTIDWKEDWQAALNIIPNDLRLKVEKTAEKWGLRCDWGCGLIISFSADFHSFYLWPAPPDSRQLMLNVNIFDDKKSVRGKLKYLETMAYEFLENVQEKLNAAGYRGLQKHIKKDIATQIQWLFWHITPPYMNSTEIAKRVMNTEGQDADPFYIQRCYQKMAKILGIKLNKGWPKGRRRARQQPRAKLQE